MNPVKNEGLKIITKETEYIDVIKKMMRVRALPGTEEYEEGSPQTPICIQYNFSFF